MTDRTPYPVKVLSPVEESGPFEVHREQVEFSLGRNADDRGIGEADSSSCVDVILIPLDIDLQLLPTQTTGSTPATRTDLTLETFLLFRCHR